MLVICKGIHLCALCWWSGVSRLWRSTSGADEELHYCALGPSHCDHAALDQSAKKLRAKLANSSRLQRYFCATSDHQVVAGRLQQRQLPLLETRNGRIDDAICFCTAGAERLAGPAARALRSVFREPLEQHVVWSHRCASFTHQSDQRIYSCLSHAAGATPRSIDPRWFLRRALYLAFVADVWTDWANQLVLPDG